MRGHMKKCIRKAAAAVLSAALLVTSESPAFAQNIQQTAVPADVITEQSRLEDGIAQTGYISDSFSEKRQEVQKEDTEGLLKSAAEQLPGQYRTQQLPAVRNQGGYGTCWAFSTIACMEINLMKKGYGETDLSELQLIYFATHSVKDKLGGLTGDDYVYTDTDINYLMRGGNYEMAVNTLSDWLSAAREESAPYETAGDVLDTGLSDELAYADVAHLQNYRSYNLQNMEDVKQAVMDYGAVGISYYAYTYSGFASNQYYNADTAGYYCYDEQTTNHAVTVVGWDDDYPAQNFPTAPEGNGAWIVRNSWGSDFGEDGYFYISYYDQSLSGSAVAFEAEPADNYDNNYQYDGSAFAMMTGKQQFKAANVFTAKANENGTEQIAAASFEVMAKQMDYTVSIYTGLTDVDNPESGELKAQKSGSFSSGDKDNLLKTVAFDEPVTVNQGEIFSVVAAFAGSGGQSVMLYYDCARTLNGIQANCAAQPHQSYIYLNEYYGWSDYGNTNNTNFRIKAFTNNVAEPDTAVTAVKLNKDDIYGIVGSVAFHLFILLILGFTVLKTVVPDEDGGILVNFGNVNAAAGTFEPKYTGQEPPQETTTPPPPVPEPKVETPKEDLVTQEIEESVAIEEAKKKKEKEEQRKKEEEKKRKEEAEKERIRKEEAEKKRLAEERRKKEQAISNKVAGAFGIGSQEGNSQGDAGSGTGNQGSPFGNSDHGANEGVGGYGSFNLNGRSIGAGGLPRPAYTIQEEGRIVINITVDPKGNVIFAEIGKGTNIDNGSMRKSALDAAKRAKFNSISGANNQSVTITYLYKLK